MSCHSSSKKRWATQNIVYYIVYYIVYDIVYYIVYDVAYDMLCDMPWALVYYIVYDIVYDVIYDVVYDIVHDIVCYMIGTEDSCLESDDRLCYDTFFFRHKNSLFRHNRFSTIFFSMKIAESGKIVRVSCIIDFKDIQV